MLDMVDNKNMGENLMNDHPIVSIGLAVYNGEDYLEEAIKSILAQTYTDFELIISDNASTDRTAEICQKYAAIDKRIRYSRNETNIGGANNENLTFRLARGKYFRWAAHDDICAPTLVEKCVAILDKFPDVSVAYSIIGLIDEDSKQTGVVATAKGVNPNPYKRFIDLASLSHDCETTYGLMRSEILEKTELQLNYTDSDRTLLCEISLYGSFYRIDEILFYKRFHPKMSTKIYPNWLDRMAWFFPNKRYQIAIPHWQQFFHYLKIISRSSIALADKFRCYIYMVYWPMRYKRWRDMGSEVFSAVAYKIEKLFKNSGLLKQLRNHSE